MSDIIQLLPDSIANQIAAGEVVQRPSSAVKELLENSVDAGAKKIKLIVRDAGKTLIQVIDDGCGMSVTDARMSFERHATSKIKKAEDLFEIKSMGFRGEALASLAAVAGVELRTKQEGDELGTELIIEGSAVKHQEPISTPNGTSIAIKNLFYNIPARRNFLKSNPVELRHINDEFFRVALSHPEIRFEYYQNDEEQYLLDPGKLSKRIVQLFGKNYSEQLIACQEETSDTRITGYIGKPEFARKTRGEQFFFINNRFIKNHYLNHAVTNAYQGLMSEDHHPFYVLFIEMDPKDIDINVHPTKTEVKFVDDRLLYGVISASVKQSLATFNVTPSLDFETDVNFTQFVDRSGSTNIKDKRYSEFQTLNERPGAKKWETLFQSADSEDQKELEKARLEGDSPTMVISSGLNNDLQPDTKKQHKTLQIHGRYLARQVKSGMVLVDQCSAHERILFERYLTRFKSQEGVSQSSLFPQQVELNSSDMTLVLGMADEIRNLGFDIQEFGKNCLVLNGVPPELVNISAKDVFEGLIEQFKINASKLDLKLNENLSRSLAKRTAVKVGHQLEETEVNELFDQLFACEQPNYTPDGQPTFVVLSLEKLASLF